MRKMLDRVVKKLCVVDTLSSLSVEDLHAMQLEAPYATVFTLLHALHPNNHNTIKTKWEDINVHANNLLWWQYVELALEEVPNEATAIELIEKEVITIEPETLELEATQTIEEEVPTVFSTALAKVKESLDAPLPKENVFIDLEPYHTVDYFASQGIKIDIIVEPKDKLGKQLKSFTDWLKTMKRIGPTPANLSINTEAEKEIVHHAASSITKDEIITETMAEVLAKQGKIDKAIEVYEQLRLINPEKNAYFAIKIQQLKA